MLYMTSRTICMADAFWALGRRADADGLLEQAKTKYGSAQAYSIAGSYALRGEKDEAFKWLDRSYANSEAQVTLMLGPNAP